MKSIYEILTELEDKCRMKISAPTSKEMLKKATDKFPKQMQAIKELFVISDGIEVNIPGTIIYPVERILSINETKKADENIEIGVTNFGDVICLELDGRIVQIDHENGEAFLEWDTIEEFLSDELAFLE